jgi:hypothetical protein
MRDQSVRASYPTLLKEHFMTWRLYIVNRIMDVHFCVVRELSDDLDTIQIPRYAQDRDYDLGILPYNSRSVISRYGHSIMNCKRKVTQHMICSQKRHPSTHLPQLFHGMMASREQPAFDLGIRSSIIQRENHRK